MSSAPIDETDVSEPARAAGVPWLAAVTALAVLVFGSALSMGVMVGLLGLPIALPGLMATTITARSLVGRGNVGARGVLVGCLGYSVGLATSVACVAFAAAAGEAVLAESRGRLVLVHGVVVHALLTHPILWLSGPMLGAVALWITHRRSAGSSALAVGLWAAAPPAAALLVSWLHGGGWMALTA